MWHELKLLVINPMEIIARKEALAVFISQPLFYSLCWPASIHGNILDFVLKANDYEGVWGMEKKTKEPIRTL